mgnify:CR=1 FL=1
MGRGGLRGSAHLGLKSSSDRRYLRGVGVQSGQKCPLCSSAREYRQGRPVHKGRTTARQVRPYAWPGHRTHISMQGQRLHAPQGRADVSPEHGWGGLSRQALNFHPQICGTRNGPVRGVLASSMSVYGKRATCTYQASRGVFSKSLASQPGRVVRLLHKEPNRCLSHFEHLVDSDSQ